MARRRRHRSRSLGGVALAKSGRHKTMTRGVSMGGRSPVGFHGTNPRKQRKMI